jgi:threonine/homoserine/homoserine lactone efflux protein
MLMTILLGIGIGFAVSIPVGPVNLAIIQAVLKEDDKRGIALGAGGAFMDLLYALMAFTGISLLHFNQLVTDIFAVAGIIFLTFLGIKELVLTTRSFELSREQLSRKRQFFLKGMMFYVTNPALIPAFIGVAGWARSLQLFPNEFGHNVVVAAFVGVGSFSWFTIFSLFINKYKEKFSMKVLYIINKFIGASLILLAVYVAYRYFFEMRG